MMLRAFVLLIGLLLAPAVACGATIVVYGDSLSSGYGIPRDESWVSLLARRLRNEGLDYAVFNASVTGETSSGGVRRIDEVLRTQRPAIVILELGGNDGLQGHSIDAMERNLDTIVGACRKARARVVLVGMHLPPNYGMAYTERFHQAFANLAKKRGLPFVPFLLEGFAENRSYFQADAVHPTKEAQPLIVDTVWRVLRPLLREPALKSRPRSERR